MLLIYFKQKRKLNSAILIIYITTKVYCLYDTYCKINIYVLINIRWIDWTCTNR